MLTYLMNDIPNNKVHGANMGPKWGRQDPGGPYVGPMNLAIWDVCNVAQVTWLLVFCQIITNCCYWTR